MPNIVEIPVAYMGARRPSAERSVLAPIPAAQRTADRWAVRQVLVIGRGWLPERLAQDFAGVDGLSVRGLEPEAGGNEHQYINHLGAALDQVDLAVLCSDDGLPLLVATGGACRRANIPLVAVRILPTTATISILPSATKADPLSGCPQCAELHRADRSASAAAVQQASPLDTGCVVPWSALERGTDQSVLASAVKLSIAEALESRSLMHGSFEATETRVDFGERSVEVEAIVRHHMCPVCQPRRLINADRLKDEARDWWHRTSVEPIVRSPPLAELLPALKRLSGGLLGLFGHTTTISPEQRHRIWRFFRDRSVAPHCEILANAHLARVVREESHHGRTVASVSEGLDFDEPDTAEALALVEGLERLFCLSYCAPERLVSARYDKVAHEAIDPRALPLFADEQYESTDFPLNRFDPRSELPWIWGVDARNGEPVLVPAEFVFRVPTRRKLYLPNSNGAACHTTVRRATVGGILEIVERDALMVTWLHRLSLPRAGISGVNVDSRGIRDTLQALDFDLNHVDITTDLGIPVLMAVLRDRRNQDFFLLDMVAGLQPGEQIAKLHRELSQFLFPYLLDCKHFVNDRTADLEPNSVASFPDHLAFYQTKAKNRQASFLTSAESVRDLRESHVELHVPEDGDERQRLDWLTRRLDEKGYRVIVVDCSTPMLQSLGLHCVKVLIPGLLPLNCGHRFRTISGERVLNVVHRMGLAPASSHPSQLNPSPHPFW